jgi:hypothetical protein
MSRSHEPQLEADAHRGYAVAMWVLIIGVLLLRLVYQFALNPYELAGDEAHYWDWSRHPSLSYYSKGPGVAMSIFASRTVFGESEFAVRLPAALFGALLMWAMARLAMRMTGGDRRAGFYAAALAAVCPPFAAVAGFMTIDSPFLACWALSIWAAWTAFEANHHKRWGLGAWAALGLAMGVGFLFKYVILLLAPAFILFMLLRGRWLGGFARWPVGLILCLIVFLATVSPVLIWNDANDWPTLKHTLGHLKAEGGDVVREPRPYDPIWTLEVIGGQIGILGPPLALLIGAAVMYRYRRRNEAPQHWTPTVFLLTVGLFTLLFFVGITYRTDVEANWPMPAFISLLIIAAGVLPMEMARFKQKLHRWLELPDDQRPKAGVFRKKPETAMQIFWHWSLAWGICAALGIAFLPVARHLPGVPDDLFKRVIGHRDKAMAVHQLAMEVEQATGQVPLIINEHYMKASLLAYYMPGQPKVYCGGSLMGHRRNAYDYFEATDLLNPDLIGRDAILVDGYPQSWQQAFVFDRWQMEHDNPAYTGFYVGQGYRGLYVKIASPPKQPDANE